MHTSPKGWTAERRAKQALAIRGWQPWKKSTGPTTVSGKARSSMNASKPDAIVLELGELYAAVRGGLRQVRRMVKQVRRETPL